MPSFYNKSKKEQFIWVLTGLFIIVLLVSGIDYGITQLKISKIPESLRINTDKDNIIGAQVIPQGKIYDKQDPTKVIYEGEVVKYAYKTNKIEDKPNEVVEKRTKHSRTIKIGEDKVKHTETYQLEVISGVPQYYEDENGEWYQADYGTTDINTYAIQTKGTVLAQLFKTEKVYATEGTFYPDANPETSTFDGYFYYTDADYMTAHNASSGDGYGDTGDYMTAMTFYWSGGPVYQLMRAIFLFNTSSLGAAATIQSATIDGYGYQSEQSNSGQSTAHIVSSNPGSNTAGALADYSSLGTTSFASITHVSFSVDAYNTFTLNSSGLLNISKTGISKFGLRISGDLDSSTPSDMNRKSIRSADFAGTDMDPKLIIIYIAPPAANAKQDVIWFE